jgi:hypothetical protein
MKYLLNLFFFSLLLGQFGGIQLIPGVTVFVHDVLAGICVAFFLIRHIHRKKNIEGTLIKPLVYFVGAAIISLLLNIGGFSHTQLILGSLYLWRFLLYACLYILARNEEIPSVFWRKRLYMTGVGFAILGILQYLFYPSLRGLMHLGWDEHYYRLFSTLLDPNFTGLFLVLSFFLGLSLYSKQAHTPIVFGQLVLGIAIILTYSRSTFLAFLVGLLTFVLFTKKTILLLTVVAGIFIYSIVPSHGIDTNRLLRADSTLARIQSYSDSIAAARIAPIFGIGYNMLRFHAARERMLDVDGIVSRDASGLNSSLMVIFVTTGVIGFSLFLYLLYRICAIFYRPKNAIGFAGIAAFVAILIHSIFNNSLLYGWILIWLWIVAGSIERERIKR